jgi:hypothetical protein
MLPPAKPAFGSGTGPEQATLRNAGHVKDDMVLRYPLAFDIRGILIYTLTIHLTQT